VRYLLLKEQNLSKRAFAKKLQDLEPKLKSTGESPTEKTIYKYLDGSIAIKIELIPYIAEVLQVSEQELFTHDEKSRRKFFQNLVKTASKDEIDILKKKFDLKFDSSIIGEPKNSYEKENSMESELISLLPYAPKPLLQNFIAKLKEIKEFNETL